MMLIMRLNKQHQQGSQLHPPYQMCVFFSISASFRNTSPILQYLYIHKPTSVSVIYLFSLLTVCLSFRS